MSFRFTSDCRIRQSSEFERIFRGRNFVNKWFSIYVIENHYKFSRLGLVISKKTISKSVNRNYAKRLIREIFRLNIEFLPTLDYVVRIRRKITMETSTEARVALLHLMLSAKNHD